MNAYNYGPHSYSPSNPLSNNKPTVNFQTRRLVTEINLDPPPTISHQTDEPNRSESRSLKYKYNDHKGMLIVPFNKTETFKPPHESYQQKVFVLHKRDSETSERSINSLDKNNMNYIRKAIDYKRKIINRLERKTRRDKYVSEIIERLATASQEEEQKQKEFSATQALLKNSRIAREIKAIKVRLEDSMRESTEVCRSFQIKSIEPNVDTVCIDRPQIKLNEQKRRNTQPNLSPRNIRRNNKNQSLSFIFIKTKKSSVITPQLRQRSLVKPTRSLRRRPFRIPFQTYYYRDFLWRINFTNQMFVEPPLEYEHRLKVFVGKGNNSSMVRGLINRRYWFAFTDRLQQANFVWTQLKQFAYFNIQKQDVPQIYQYQPRDLMLLKDTTQYQNYSQISVKIEQRGDERFFTRQKAFSYRTVIRHELIKSGKMHNHLQHNYIIGNKKALVSTMTSFYRSQGQDPFKVLPLTFHIKMGLQDPTFLQFQKYYHNRGKQIRKRGDENRQHNLWIVKPGQNSNRGTGIHLCLSLQQIKTLIKPRERWPDGGEKTFIVQSYIERPLLYHKRKFDLRHYMLITRIKGCLKGYWYQEGYVRTASAEYKLNNSAGAIHLTNDAIQKGLADYGRYEKGNKLSYADLDNHIGRLYKGKGFYQDIYPVMKTIATDAIKASASLIDPLRLQNNFQLFGLDFMIDNELKVWLIEVNSNPCLQLSCPLLARLIPNLIENVLQMTLDAMYPPPIRYSPKMPRYLQDMNNANKFELVFDQRVERLTNPSIAVDQQLMQQEEDTFQDNGSEWEEDAS